MTRADRRSGFLILLVEDNPADQRLLEEELACAAHPSELFAVHDGQAALDFLHRRRGEAAFSARVQVPTRSADQRLILSRRAFRRRRRS